MNGLSFGDLAQAYALKSRISSLKTKTTALSEELATGLKSDVGKALSGDLRGLAAMEHARTVLKGYMAAGQHTGVIGKARLSVVEQITEHLTGIKGSVATLSQGSSFDQIHRVSNEAKGKLEDAIRQLNTEVAGRPIFAGVATNGPAVASADAMLSELAALTSGATTAAEIESQILNWFNDPNGFGLAGYRGAASAPSVVLAADGTSVSDRTAADPRIATALAGLALASLVNHPGLSSSGADRMALKHAALGQLSIGTDATIDLAGQIGSDLATIDTSISHQLTEDLSIEMAISDTVSADPARTATELEAVRTNLETVYAVTARLSRLTLAEFLR